MRRFLSLLALAQASVITVQPAAAMSSTSPPYCTVQDVTDAYATRTLAQLTGDGTGAVVTDTLVAEAVENYGGQMYGYIRGRYPAHDFGQTEPVLRPINVEGAYLMLCQKRPGGLSQPERDDLARLDRKLRDIAGGVIVLATNVEAGESPPLDPEELFRANPRRYGRTATSAS